MFEISGTKVYGLAESLVAAGLPKDTGIIEDFFKKQDDIYHDYNCEIRAEKLGNVPIGSGHDCFLKGIIVQMNIRYPQYFSLQFQRYHFHDIISSQSKMHKILTFNIDKQCNEYTDIRAIELLQECIQQYKKAASIEAKNHLFKRILANTPMGFELTMRVSTNYLQLKTIYSQRVNSDAKRMDEWRIFCNWCESLPYFKQFVLKGGK